MSNVFARSFRFVALVGFVAAVVAGGVMIAGPMPAAAAGCTGMEYDGTDGVWFLAPCPNGQTDPAFRSDYHDKYAAIAVSSKTLSYGYSWQADSRAQAEQIALSACKKHAHDCAVEMWGLNECLALAVSVPEKTWGVDYDRNGAMARNKALRQCREGDGTRCKVVADPCSHDASN